MGREKWWTLMHLKREDNAIKAYLYTLLSDILRYVSRERVSSIGIKKR